MNFVRKHVWKVRSLCAVLFLGAATASAAAQPSYDRCPTGPLPSGYDWSDVKDELEASSFARGGLIVYHKGALVYWTGFGWWDGQSCQDFIDDHNFNVASLSKTYTAALAMAVAQDTNVNLSLNDLVKDHIPNAPSLNADMFNDNGVARYVYDHMTLEDLITMTTGHKSVSAWPLGITSCVNNPNDTFEQCGEEMIAASIDDDPDYCTLLGGCSYAYAPGDAFSYGPMSWQILGLALVNAVNTAYPPQNGEPPRSFTDVLDEYLTGTNACDFANTRVTPAGNEWPAGGFETDLFDGGAFAQALLSGQCGSFNLLDAASRADLTELMVPLITGRCDGSGNCEPVPVVSNPAKKLNLDYARGQWIYDPADGVHSKVYMGVGAWGAITFYSPENDWAAYIHLDDHVLSGYKDASNLITKAGGLAALIDEQAVANP